MSAHIRAHLPLEPLPLESTGLAAHLALCTRSRGRLHALRALAESVHGILAPRFVSTVAVLTFALAGLAWLVH